MNRRNLLTLTGCSAFAFIASRIYAQSDNNTTVDTMTNSIEPIERSASEWRERLSEAEFRVLRKEGTEKPYTSELLEEDRQGTYVCAGCELPLFKSETKFESGTGWPSFYDHIPNHINTKRDFKLLIPRTEYHCARCGGHQGHVFEDGPEPTGLRYCNNGVALNFVPA